MIIEIEIHKVSNQWWTYHICIDGKMIKTIPFTYRMYYKEATARRNAYRAIEKYLKK